MLRYLTVFACILAESAALAEDRWSLSAEQWARPRSGASLVSMEPLAEVVRHLHENGEQRLFIAYPGGEEGSLWAFELRSWLVALGVPSRRIQLTAGSGQDDALELRIQD
ncbi:MAG: hypothetical protein OQL11_06800 [Gammaproteobacteria bacterium]|nr:hypothetical protein [Gammaproteobacteria bacterium]